LRPGIVQQVRVLLERTYQKLREAPQFRIIPKDPPREMAVGQEFDVGLDVEGIQPSQVVYIKSNSGDVVRTDSGWFWKGTLPEKTGTSEYDASIVLRGLDNRNVGRKSQADTSFTVHAVLPTLGKDAIPAKICLNEPFRMNMKVEGLDNFKSYRLVFSLNGVEKPHLTGPDHMVYPQDVRIRDLKLGDTIGVKVRYDGKEVKYYDGELKPLEWIRVVQPRELVVMDYAWEEQVSVKSTLQFYAYLGCNPECTECISPIPPESKIEITITRKGVDVTNTFLGGVDGVGDNYGYLIKFKPGCEKAILDRRNGDLVTIKIKVSTSLTSNEISKDIRITP